ncbi:MAG: leucyl aminopeptidase [Gammaproteobacteria bacterium]|nr:leucyl aminopeptidase [Beggiatoa alba]PCH60945.1 MAG: leucyl aminopeptidase [Gammaproteobacteria bacterium]
MEFIVKSGHPEKQRSACVIVGVSKTRRLSAAAERLDEASGGYISNILRRGDLDGDVGQTLLLYSVENILCDRILLVGCGRDRDLDERQYRKIITSTIKALQSSGVTEAVSFLSELHVKGRDSYWKIRQAIETAHAVCYRFDNYKTTNIPPKRRLRRMVLTVPSRRNLASGEKAVSDGIAIANGVELAKNLGNHPANVCTPSYLEQEAHTLAKRHRNLTIEVLNEEKMEKLGMGSLLSVTRGTKEPAKLIIFKYKGAKKEQPHVLVGKGVTFDTGGISIKPAAAMDEMKYDMCGAASVFGTVSAIAEMKLAVNLIGIVPAVENMPSSTATKPGDIVTSMSGQTIEILNTDAEGRLILCDALSYAERFEPASVIDIATLTGACLVALGHHMSAVIGNNSSLVNELQHASKTSDDKIWELPMSPEYDEQINSPFADMANIGGRTAGTITAACFLSRFTKKMRWAHLDIAGTAWVSGKEKGATGRPVPLLTQYLMDRCE